jgi:hypothetical protein
VTGVYTDALGGLHGLIVSDDLDLRGPTPARGRFKPRLIQSVGTSKPTALTHV